MRIEEIGDEFERLVSGGLMEWRTADASELPPFARAAAESMLDAWGVAWELGSVTVGGAVCLRLDDERVRYLDVYPETGQFLWCLEGHHESVHPDEVLVRFARRRHPGVELGRSGSVLVDNRVVIEDLRRKR